MKYWDKFLQEVIDAMNALESDGCIDPYFRGHADSSWALLPSLARRERFIDLEGRLYYGFTSLGGHLIPPGATGWDILFLMQHHGIPTRLLDWSENFAVALHFAIQNRKSESAIWILDPYDLNEQALGVQKVKYLNQDFQDGYEYYFIPDIDEEFPADVIAIGSDSRTSRVRSQRGVFTLHQNLDQALEEIYPSALKKIILPREAVSQARRFLRLAGVNEFSLFPDLDGLARHLLAEELGNGHAT